MHEMSDKNKDDFVKILDKVSSAWNLTEFQRDQSNESIRFVDVSGAQWEGWAGVQFANRPRMELDKASQSVNLFQAEWRTNRFAVKYRSSDEKTSAKDAEFFNGLFRKDYRDSNGEQSMDNVVNEMSKGGVGALRLKTEFVSEDDPENMDQKIIFEPLYNAYNTVVWDPQAKAQDKNDAGWCDIITTYTEDAFNEAYPDASPESFFQPSDRNIFNLNNIKLIYVSEHYQVKKKKALAFSYKNKLTGEKRVIFKDDIEEVIGQLADAGFRKTGERRIMRKTIEKSILFGGGFLSKPRRIVGDMIPVAPCYGYRSYVDGQEYYYGLVEKQKDAQRLSNMAISNMAENAATSSASTPILTPDQVAGHEQRWAEKALSKHAYMLLNSLDEQGKPIPLGPLQHTQPHAIDPNTSLILDVAGNYIVSQSGGMPQDTLDPDASGKAINAMIQRVDMQTAVLMDNISLCTKTVGKIYLGMASEVYDTERFIKLVGEDGSEKDALLMEYVLHPKVDKFVRINDVKAMKLDVVVDTGASYANQRRETVDVLGQLLQNIPQGSQYEPLILAGIIENIEGAGLEGIKKFNRQQQILQGTIKAETEEDLEFVQSQSQQQQQPDAAMVLAQAEDKKGDADIAEVQRKTQADQFSALTAQQKNQVETFRAQTDRIAVQIDAEEAGATINSKNIDSFGKEIDNRQKQIDVARQVTGFNSI